MSEMPSIEIPKDISELATWDDNLLQAAFREFRDFPGWERRKRILAIAMKQMPAPLRERQLSNMSKRMAVIFRELMRSITDETPEEAAAAKESFLLSSQYTLAIRIKRDEAVRMHYPGLPAMTISPSAAETQPQVKTPDPDLSEMLAGSPIKTRSPRELLPLFKALTKRVRQKGLLSLEELLEGKIDDDFLRECLQMVVDGEPPQIIREVLQARIRELPREDEPRLTFIAAAVTAIAEGRSSERLEERCSIHLPEVQQRP